MIIDVEALIEIERAQVPADYFKSFAATIQAAKAYAGVVISYVGPMSYPDLAARWRTSYPGWREPAG